MSNGFFADEDEAVTDATTERMIRQRAAEMVREVLNQVFKPDSRYLIRAWAVGFVFGASWTYGETVAGVSRKIGCNRKWMQQVIKNLRDRFELGEDNLRAQSNAVVWRERKKDGNCG
jgi:hypothetical protein